MGAWTAHPSSLAWTTLGLPLTERYVCSAPITGGAAMSEELMIIEMNIARYEAMLKLDLGSQKQAAVKRLLAECKEELILANKDLSQLKLERCAVSGKLPRE